MTAVTIRNIPEETHRAIKARARAAGRSTEAEIRFVLESTYRPKEQLGIGSAIHAIAMKYGGFELEIVRDKTPAIYSAAKFE